VELFVSETDLTKERDSLRERLARELPARYRGYSTHFTPPNPNDHGTQLLVEHAEGPIRHRVELQTVARGERSCAALCRAYETLVAAQRELGLPVGVDSRTSQFWGRPFRVIWGDRIADTVFATIADPHLATLAKLRRIGNIDAVSDSTDVLENVDLRPRLRAL
jgi:hypothetical protein